MKTTTTRILTKLHILEEKSLLVPCKACGRQISKRATKCPQCGQARGGAGRFLLLFVLAVVIAWLLGALNWVKFLV